MFSRKSPVLSWYIILSYCIRIEYIFIPTDAGEFLKLFLFFNTTRPRGVHVRTSDSNIYIYAFVPIRLCRMTYIWMCVCVCIRNVCVAVLCTLRPSVHNALAGIENKREFYFLTFLLFIRIVRVKRGGSRL